MKKILLKIYNIYYKLYMSWRYKKYDVKTNVEWLYKKRMGKQPDLSNPQTFNEKLQWLKVYWHDDLATICADKYRVREYVKEQGCGEILNKLYGVWDNANDIDFDKLPDSFVLKVNHGCGYNIFVEDKSKANFKKIRKQLNIMLKQKYYIYNYEWVYKDIKPKIIAERLFDVSKGFPIDYKFFCFDGKVDCVMVCIGRFSDDARFYFFDNAWQLLRLNKRGLTAPVDFTLPKPRHYAEMINIANKLSSGLPFVRVDLYEDGDSIIFGELTFFPDSGMDRNILAETDNYFGQLINIRGV